MTGTKFVILDKTVVFDRQIEPILKDLTSLLRHNQMPYFIAIATASDNKETHYHYDSNDIWIPGSCLVDDKIPSFINIVNGFRTVPPGNIIEVDL